MIREPTQGLLLDAGVRKENGTFRLPHGCMAAGTHNRVLCCYLNRWV